MDLDRGKSTPHHPIWLRLSRTNFRISLTIGLGRGLFSYPSRDYVDLALYLADLIGAEWGVSGSALSGTGDCIEIREVTPADQLCFLRSHQATIVGADDIESTHTSSRPKEGVSNCSTCKVSCKEELRLSQDHITRLRNEVTSASRCLCRCWTGCGCWSRSGCWS